MGLIGLIVLIGFIGFIGFVGLLGLIGFRAQGLRLARLTTQHQARKGSSLRMLCSDLARQVQHLASHSIGPWFRSGCTEDLTILIITAEICSPTHSIESLSVEAEDGIASRRR